MPPKPRVTREEIVAAALDIVSRKGIEALTARELGEALGSSARPIFTVFRSMEELQQEVRSAASRAMPAVPCGASRCLSRWACRWFSSARRSRSSISCSSCAKTAAPSALTMCSEEQLGRMLSTEFQAMMLLVKSGGQS